MFKKITVIGGGILGSQIAYQSAFHGFEVTVWLRSEASVERSKPKFERLHNIYLADLEATKLQIGKENPVYSRGLIADFAALSIEKLDALKKQADRAYTSIVFETDLAKALAQADLVIESLAEDPQQKIDFFRKAAPLLPAHTVMVTNSSTMIPSQFAEYTGRSEKFLALHFANSIWKSNTAEVMGHAGTDQAAYDQVAAFAKAIHMVPLLLKKEQPGYILNSMLVPFLNAAEALFANDVADPQTIDLTWRLGVSSPLGPFQILDIIGLNTAYNVVCMHPQSGDMTTTPGKIAAKLKEYIDAGKTGVQAGEGFYKYK